MLLGSRRQQRGYFPGPFNGADVTVKDSKRYADTRGWGYYNFNHHEPKAPTAKVKQLQKCAYCHIASAKKDEVWTQFYPPVGQVISSRCDIAYFKFLPRSRPPRVSRVARKQQSGH